MGCVAAQVAQKSVDQDTLLLKEFQPNWFMQAGLLFCSAFFFGVSGIVLGLLL